MRILILALICAAFVAPQKAAASEPEQNTIKAKVTINGHYTVTKRGAEKNKTLEKIVAVAQVPLAQLGEKKKGDAVLTISEDKKGKRTMTFKNIKKGSELHQKLQKTLDESISYYKQNHQNQAKK